MNKEKKDLLFFGYGLAVISLFLCWRISVKHGWSIVCWAFVASCMLSLWMTLFRQDMLKAFYKQWMKAAHFIGGVVTAVILSFIFYCVFSVVGIILRVMGKDLLHQTIDRQAKSYWRMREDQAFDKKNYTRQF